MTKKYWASGVMGLLVVSGAYAAGAFQGLPVAVTPLTGIECIPADTNLTQGLNPATECITSSQVAASDAAAVTVPFAATTTIDASLSKLYIETLTGNITFANPTNLTSGKSFKIELIQDSTGSRTVTWGSEFAWPAATAPTLTTTASAVDMISCTYDNATLNKLRCSSSLNVH